MPIHETWIELPIKVEFTESFREGIKINSIEFREDPITFRVRNDGEELPKVKLEEFLSNSELALIEESIEHRMK